MSGSLTKFGIGKETTYGTAVAVTKSYEIISEDFKGNYPRLQAEALSGSYVDRGDRFMVNNKGASGTVTLEPLTRSFGDFMATMMGTVATTGPTETSVYTHTATMGSLSGKSLTVQVLRADETDTLNPWTYEGGKITNFEISNSVDQTLRASIGFDFEKESNPDAPSAPYTSTVLNGLTTPSGANVLNWQYGNITVGGSQIEVSEISIKVDNALNTDRYFISQTGGKKEPKQDGKRKIEWSFTTTYLNNNFWEKVSSATIAGSYAVLNAFWEGPILLGTTLYPHLELQIPMARFDEGGPTVSGPSALEQQFSGMGLYDGTNSALTMIYKSGDTTVLL
jgi:Phage tail tube protein